MSPVRSAPYYWAECDGCGANLQEDADFAAWSDYGVALDASQDGGAQVFKRDGADFIVCDQCCRLYVLSIAEDERDAEDELLADGHADHLFVWLARPEAER